MDISTNGLQVDYPRSLTDSDPAAFRRTLLSLPTSKLKADPAHSDKQHFAPLHQRTTTRARQTDKLLGNCLANTAATRAMPSTGLVMSYDSWLHCLQSAIKTTSPAILAMIEGAKDRVTSLEQLVFIIERSLGFGDLNLYIEVVRCFQRLSPNTIKRIEFTCDNLMIKMKFAPLISGFSQASNAPADYTTACDAMNTTTTKTEPAANGTLFGINYIITDKIPDADANTLYIYTANISENKLPTNCQSVQIINYRWFRSFNRRKDGIVLNKENHLPVYPCEIMAAITSKNRMEVEIAQSFAELCSNGKGSVYTSPTEVSSLFGEIFSQAAAGKIHMAFCYHSQGICYHQYRFYIQAALRCFGDKPIIFIAPKVHDFSNYLSEQGHKLLADEVSVEFINVRFLTDRSTIDLTNNKQVTVIQTGILPKRVVELIALFSTLPGFGPGASTANLFECLGVPYLGQDGHDLTTAGDVATAQHWQFINSVFDFNISDLQDTLGSFETYCDTEKRHILENWLDSTQYEPIEKNEPGYIFSTFLYHFFQGTSVAPEFVTLSPEQRKDYVDRLLADESLIKQYLDYLDKESITVIANYLLSATTPDGEFRNHAITLQQRALNPENNTLLEVIRRHFSFNSASTTTRSQFQAEFQQIFSFN